MSSRAFYFCDLCGKQTTEYGPKTVGICWELGFSLGGWGQRDNIHVFSGAHCCTKCFEKYEAAAIVFLKAMGVQPRQKTQQIKETEDA